MSADRHAVNSEISAGAFAVLLKQAENNRRTIGDEAAIILEGVLLGHTAAPTSTMSTSPATASTLAPEGKLVGVYLKDGHWWARVYDENRSFHREGPFPSPEAAAKHRIKRLRERTQRRFVQRQAAAKQAVFDAEKQARLAAQAQQEREIEEMLNNPRLPGFKPLQRVDRRIGGLLDGFDPDVPDE